MFQTLKNAWKTPELKTKLLFTLVIVILYRLGANIPIPWVNPDTVSSFATQTSGTVLEYLSILSGGAMSQATLFALSVSPYITASIVMQLLTIAIPKLEELSKNGEEGKKKINAITRLVTVALALVTSFGYTTMIISYGMTTFSVTANPVSIFKAGYGLQFITMIACYCAGAALVMWLAEQINEKGIGNGISIILFVNILAGLPTTVNALWKFASMPIKAAISAKKVTFAAIAFPIFALLIIAVLVAATYFCVWFTNSERRLTVKYAKRVVGRKQYGGQTSNLPLKLNMSGVMPIIFANAIVTIPATIAAFANRDGKSAFWNGVTNIFNINKPLYIVINIGLLIAFSFFYIMISFNPVEVANNIQNNGGMLPGRKPGKPTREYIQRVLNRVTFIGAIFLCIIAGVPMIVNAIVSIGGIQNSIIGSLHGMSADLVEAYQEAGLGSYLEGTTVMSGISSLAFSGSSLLIVIGVALETIRELEAQLTMRNYKGFLD